MGKKSIAVNVYLDGASKFTNDIRSCDNSLKQFQSELKRTTEEFRNNENSYEALARKSETLQKAYDASSKKVDTYSKRIAELNKARSEEEQRIESLRKRLEEEEKSLVNIEKASGKNSDAYRTQAKVCEELNKEIKASATEIDRLDKEEVRLNTSLNNAAAQQLKYGNELDKTNTYLSEAEASSDGYAKSLDRVGHEVDTADKAAEKMGKTLELLMRNEAFEKISESAKKVMENLVNCAEVAEKFEYSIAKVQSIAQVSEKELAGMSSEIRRVSTEMGYGVNEIAEATYQAISASVDASEAVGFVENATKLARAGFTESATAVDVLTTAINAYGKESNTAAHIADDLITTQNLGKTTVNELAQSMGTVIPTASALGVSLDQLSSMYVLMTKQGINTANSTTYIRAMMNELSDSGSDLADTLSGLTGHTFGELMAQGYTVGDVMQILGDSVNGNSEAFKNLFSNVRAGLGGLSLFNQGADAFNDTLEVMEHNAGATDKAFETMADTAEMTNARFKASAENLQIAIGESLSPALEGLKEAGITALDFLTGVVEENPEFVGALAGATTAIGITTTAVTGLALAISVCKAAFGDFSGILALSVAGIVAGSGALVGYGVAAANTKDENEKLQESYRETAEASRELNTSVDEMLKSHEDNGKHIDELIKRIENLNSIENLSAKQKYELKTAANDLNAILGETVIEIDQQTDHISQNTEKWKENALAKEEAAKRSGLEEKYNEVLQDRAKIEGDLWEIEDRREDIAGRLAEIDEELLELQNKGLDLSIAEQDQMQKLQDEAKALTDEENALSEAYSEQAKAKEENIEKQEKLTEAIDKTKEAEEEAAKAAGEYTDSLGVVHESSIGVADAEEAIKDATEHANEAINNQIGLFDEWNGKSSKTFEEMQKNWEKTAEGLNQYQDDLDYLGKVTIDQNVDPSVRNLAETFSKLGVDQAGEIHEVVEELQNVGDLSKLSADSVDKLTGSFTAYTEALESANTQQQALYLADKGFTEDAAVLWTDYYAQRKTDHETFNQDMSDLAAQGEEDQSKAIEDNMYLVEEASQRAMESALARARETIDMPTTGGTSGVYKALGEDIVNSIVDGFDGGDQTIGGALGNILQRAADNVDVSGVAARINEKLNDSLNREINR